MVSPTAELITEYGLLKARLDRLERRWECDRPDCDGLPHEGWLHHHARAAQHEPDDYRTWLLLTGRGFGKTRTGSETVKKWSQQGLKHIAVIAKSDREVRSICFEGPAGLLRRFPKEDIYRYYSAPGATRLVLNNGCVFRAFSAEDPDVLRGYAFDGAWCDEYAAWSMNTAQNVMDMLWFCLREAAHPKVLVTTTPKPLPHIVKLLDRAKKDNAVYVTRGATRDNASNLSAETLTELHLTYAGTRLGRQELEGEVLEDIEGALWSRSMIESCRVTEAPPLIRIVVAIDPAVTSNENSDETGIVVVGLASNFHYYVLEDCSVKASPDAWAKVAVAAYERWNADRIIGEANNGGDMIEVLIRQVAPQVSYRKVTASRGKQVRAEPISAIYEQGRAHHVGTFPRLEDQMVVWSPESSNSPDRMDALVWAITELMSGATAAASLTALGSICPNCGMPNIRSATVCVSCKQPMATVESL